MLHLKKRLPYGRYYGSSSNSFHYETQDQIVLSAGGFLRLKQLIIHRGMVELRINEFLERDIHIRKLNKKEEENLNNLKMIKSIFPW